MNLPHLTRNARKRLTAPDLIGKKNRGEKITMLTAYDYTMASLLDASGVDVLLVGDSMAMVVQGHENTLPVTLDEMIYHSEMVGRGSRSALVVVDIPFPINHQGIHQCVTAAGRILKETRCQAVKLEGGAEQAEVIKALVTAGIPVMAHVGLRPQAVHTMGGYKIQRDRGADTCWMRLPLKRRERLPSSWNASLQKLQKSLPSICMFLRLELVLENIVMGRCSSSMICSA